MTSRRDEEGQDSIHSWPRTCVHTESSTESDESTERSLQTMSVDAYIRWIVYESGRHDTDVIENPAGSVDHDPDVVR